jgi:copper(I)-binding protein
MVLAAALSSTAVSAAEPDGVSLSDMWFRFITPTIPAAGYFTLSNSAAAPRTLIGANSSACGSLMLHQSVARNGVERMIMVPKVAVPPHGSLQFAPGGYHLMCMSPAAAMRPGHSVPVTLQFEGGGTLTGTFPVRGATGK